MRLRGDSDSNLGPGSKGLQKVKKETQIGGKLTTMRVRGD